MGMALFIIFALLAVAALCGSGYYLRDTIKNTVIKVDYKSLFKKLALLGGGFVVSLTMMFISIYWWGDKSPKGWEVLATVFGGILFSAATYISLSTFVLHYYSKNTPKEIDKWLFRSLMIAFPLMFVFVLLLSNGFANYLPTPLANGFIFSKDKISYPPDKPNIAFYALCILSGAIYAYFYSDHKLYLKYGKHGLLESTFFVAFPAGIIGARLFYVIGVYEKEFKGRPVADMFDLTKGGLTILGGAITGIVVGVAWFMWRHRNKYNIFDVADIVLPMILVAQAVGRWGNFFNCEVHGELVKEEYWNWLPKVIFNNSHFSESVGAAPAGYLYAPLFFVEGIINLLGFFVLAHLFGIKFKKYLKPGDVAFGYIIWYGLTRIFMEPLRHPNYQMNTWSWIWSISFLVIGMLLVGINHLVRGILDRKNNKYVALENEKKRGLIGTLVVSIISITFVVIGISMMSTTNFVKELKLNQFNSGLIFLFTGISILMLLMVYIPYLVPQKESEVVHE